MSSIISCKHADNSAGVTLCLIDAYDRPSPGVCGRCAQREDAIGERLPLIIRLVAKFRSEADTGAGDTLERIIRTAGIGNAYKAVAKKLFGGCGCDRRKKELNLKYRYSNIR